MAIDLYLLPTSSPCRAVLMTCRQLGLRVNLKHVSLLDRDQYREEFIKINPLHLVPTIDDDGFYLWESRAIMTYLADTYAPGSDIYPKDPKRRAEVDKFLYFDAGTLFQTMAQFVYPQVFRKEAPNPAKEQAFRNALSFLNSFLEKNQYLTGNHLTLADLTILANLTFTENINVDYSPFPHLERWLDQLKQLPYYEEINGAPLRRLKEVIEEIRNQKHYDPRNFIGDLY